MEGYANPSSVQFAYAAYAVMVSVVCGYTAYLVRRLRRAQREAAP